ncbi:MAG: hypothetical protein WC222_03085 [Parachlamydiales bacterium]|jgi:hypothetical protein
MRTFAADSNTTSSTSYSINQSLKAGTFFTLLSTAANTYKYTIAFPLAGFAIGSLLAALAVKLADKHNFSKLSQIMHKCYNIADRTKLLRLIVCILLIIGSYWMPLTMLIASIPVAFLSVAYSIRNIQMNRK